MRALSVLALFALPAALWPQAPANPVVNPRGVVNAFTQQPAPTAVAPGGIIWINGLNLGPPEGAKAPANAWPTELGGVQVMVNARPAAIGSVEPSRIVAQVPWEVPAGAAQVVVRRGGASSRPARINVQNPLPALRSAEDTGYGEAAGTVSGNRLTLAASGLGPTEPRIGTGEAGPRDPKAEPRVAVRAHVGGIGAGASAAASVERVGEFEVTVEIPEGARPGDVVAVEAGNRLANVVTYRKLSAPEVRYVRLPAGAPELRAVASSDLRGGYFIASGARDDNGCWPSVLFDLNRSQAAAIPTCLTAANSRAATPVIETNNGAPLAALAGPPQGEAPAGVSAKAIVFHPQRSEAMAVDLPAPAVSLASAPGANFMAVIPGTPPQAALIDTGTGEVRAAAVGGAGGAGAAGGALNPASLRVDLGGGVDKLLSPPVAAAEGLFAVVVGDDENTPTRAKMAVVNLQGEVVESRDFPEGWAPLVAPLPPQTPGQGQLPGILQAIRFRVSQFADGTGQNRVIYVLSRKTDDSAHGFASFALEEIKPIAFPSGWFAAACTANIPIANIELSRRIALFGSNKPDRVFQQQCTALAFLVMDLANQSVTAVELPGRGQINANARLDDINDYLLGANPGNDTVYVLDGVNLAASRFDLPPGIESFAGLRPVPALGIAVANGRIRAANDGGFVLFDLENVTTRVLPVPNGFATATLVDVFPATRKLVARGILEGNAGSQLLIYDLNTGDLAIVANPEGVAFIGAPPAQQPGGGGPLPGPGGGGGGGGGGGAGGGVLPQQPALVLQQSNPKANTVEAIVYDAARRQVGAISVRIP